MKLDHSTLDLGDVTLTPDQITAARLTIAKRCPDPELILDALGIGPVLRVVVAP